MNDKKNSIKKFFAPLFSKRPFIMFCSSVTEAFAVAMLFDIFSYYVWDPVNSFIWGKTLILIPGKYIGGNNLIELIKNPIVTIVGLVLIAIRLLLSYWEVVALVLIVEYGYQGKRINVLRLMEVMFEQTKHVVKIKNWPIFIFTGLFVELTDFFGNGSKLTGFVLPEYIMDVVQRTLLRYLYMAVLIALVVLIVKSLSIIEYSSLEKLDFKESLKKSFRLTKGRLIQLLVLFILYTGYCGILVYVPRMLFILLSYGLSVIVGNDRAFAAAREYFIMGDFVTVLDAVTVGLVSVSVIGFMVYMWHYYKNQDAEETVPLPDKYTSSEGIKIHSYKWVLIGVYSFLAILGISGLILFTVMFRKNPEIASEYISSMEIVAHRGYSAEAPENTIPAFEVAYKTNVVDYVELDVHPSAEGIPVVMHDSNTARTTGHNADISELTLEELKKLDAGGWFSEEYKNTPVPTLEETIQFADGKIKLLIEIKNHSNREGFEEEIARIIKKYNFENQCLIQSSSYESLKKIKEADPNLKCGWIMPMGLGMYYDLPYLDFFSVEHTFITSKMVNEIHKRDKKVYAWTVNEENFLREMIFDGVDGIIGDSPNDSYKIIHEKEDNIKELIIQDIVEKPFSDVIENLPGNSQEQELSEEFYEVVEEVSQ